MKTNFKRYLQKICTIILMLLMIFSFMPVKANMRNGGGTASPNAFYAPGPFSFSGMTQDVKSYDGKYMAVEISATSGSGTNQTVTLEVYVDKTGVAHTYTIKTDGQNNKFDYIPLGNDGGSDVMLRLFANVNVTATVKSYSWY